MAAVMKTPGVYIVEKSAFPSSVVEVATAVPVFIGYTEKADNKGKSLAMTPWRITSMAEYMSFFGGAPTPVFSFAAGAASEPEATTLKLGGKEYSLSQVNQKYMLFSSMALFFQNGGGPCYVVSVGDYESDIEADDLKAGVDLLIKEQEPTIVVVPEAIRLKQPDCIGVQQYMLNHCGNVMRNRVSVLDISDGHRSRQDPNGDPVEAFRDALGVNFLDFGMAYYPWLNTTVNQSKDFGFWNLDEAGRKELQTLLTEELGVGDVAADDKKGTMIKEIVDDVTNTEMAAADRGLRNSSLITLSQNYNLLLKELVASLNVMPPSAAMAGVFTMVDNNRGVWKAPANVSLNSVVSPSVNITHGDQEDLNVTPQGKSINAIRPFVGEGTLIWGARTLDGNSLDWRYINVRRTMIMLEESIKMASKAYVFEPNTANTWVTIKSMIRNFLTGVWKRGGLAGTSPDDAFAVFCGLGETMTPEDILEGIMRVTVLVAISRPAEFIEITFQQQMQKS